MGRKYRITVQDSGLSFECGDDSPVFEAMLRNGKGPVKNGCCGGGCGVCKARIISGSYSAFKPMSAAHVSEDDVKQNFALLCCIQPRSDMVITMQC